MKTARMLPSPGISQLVEVATVVRYISFVVRGLRTGRRTHEILVCDLQRGGNAPAGGVAHVAVSSHPVADHTLAAAHLRREGTLGHRASLQQVSQATPDQLLCGCFLGSRHGDQVKASRKLSGVPLYRQATGIAMASLGAIPDATDLMCDRGDRDGLNAFALAVGVGASTSAERVGAFSNALPFVAPEHFEWAEEIASRFAEGATVDAMY